MNSILDDIRLNYQSEISARLTREKRKLNSKVAEKQDKLFEVLTDEQRELFEQYQESRDIYQSASDKDCFIDGVSFGVILIMNAIKADGK